jgi:HD-like signal output (HDOD) protein
MSTTESNDLIAGVVQLPVRPGAAMRLLWMLDDTQASASDLGRLIESDPALSTQVLGLANTPF